MPSTTSELLHKSIQKLENVKGICGNEDGAKHKAEHHFPTTQGATFTSLGDVGRESRVLGAFSAGPQNPGGLQESAFQSSF